ncbi:hypothetical protein PSJE_01425 [Pseudomonas jessenii]|uniref:Uncharacterized protein n=1 Tax=Pseudomonas jessenii TaxID=77298 RepID=A0A231GQK5_PSEJE|nr:hypothetical protein [Pseudomonas jessenii]OXR38900.1 hypothetical protein PSJE_01425 [Pseudomonas jessenii]SEC42528.1 hypothetical protein SAMN04490187_4319 [Pseudomonas jessenii]
MNAAKQQNVLAGQTSLARKVFRVVPIQERWSAHDIFNSLVAAEATGAQFSAVRRGLGELKEAGLIREPVNGHYQRTAITIKPPREQSMSQETTSAVVAIKNPKISALDTLAVLSGEVIRFSEEVAQRMKKLATRIEEVALSVETEREANAEALDKFKQLQSLLKGF